MCRALRHHMHSEFVRSLAVQLAVGYWVHDLELHPRRRLEAKGLASDPF